MADIAKDTNLPAVSDDKDEDAKADKASKGGKPEKKKGPGAREKSMKFFRDTKGEFKKIIWPTKDQLFRDTGATLVMCAIVGVAVGLFDLGLSALIKLIVPL